MKLTAAGDIGPGQGHTHCGDVGGPLDAIRRDEDSLWFLVEQWCGLPAQALELLAACRPVEGSLLKAKTCSSTG